MINTLVEASIKAKGLVLIAIVVVLGYGIHEYR